MAFQNCGEAYQPLMSDDTLSSNQIPIAEPDDDPEDLAENLVSTPNPNSPPAPPTSPPATSVGLKNQWLRMPTSGAPSARAGASAVWSGTQMIVFGGNSKVGDKMVKNSDGGLYDPRTNMWQPLASSSVVGRRAGHSAISTGTKMLVFGGFDSQALSTGAIYNYATDTWSPMSNSGAPSPRYAHTAVWTGSKMIVFGGSDGTTQYKTGGIYDLATNKWTAISTAGAPDARFDHTAVWTGSKMIVFGGRYRASGGLVPSLYSGGIYDPAKNAWESLPNMPHLHHAKAVWTGTKMLVLGGVNILDEKVSSLGGAIYDPATKKWKAINNKGAPRHFSGASVIWTGKKAILFGGAGSKGDGTHIDVQGGGIYDPETDNWEKLPTANSPSARSQHNAVWTGSEMVVFGGRTIAGEHFNNGGVFQ